MINEQDYKHHDRMRRYCVSPMLMLGNQDNPGVYSFGINYMTLDPDGGDFQFDLNYPIGGNGGFGPWRTVYNLGTVEHVWDISQAFISVANMIAMGGHYLGSHPVGGYEDHGIHVLEWTMIRRFFTLNGFTIKDEWFCDIDGVDNGQPVRGSGRSTAYYCAAEKTKSVRGFYRLPQQRFVNGVKL
jgi:hypothetical protein